jgi:hypothetical protein
MLIIVLLIMTGATLATGLAQCGTKSPITILIRPNIAPAILDFEDKTMYYRFRESK